MSLSNIDEIVLAQDEKIYVNKQSYSLFENILNEAMGEVVTSDVKVKLGTSFRQGYPEKFVSKFNQWVSLCLKKGVMVKTLSSNSASKVIFNEKYNNIEAWAEGLKVLKELGV
tara:strand:- start:1274 stop:1612 length:339 start_codon:yes stop_codon:yes gene_type:complete